MKKRLVAFLLVCVVALSFAVVPAMAAEVVAPEPVNATAEQGIVPATHMVQMFWRTYHGVLQWRLWSITDGRWLSDWTDVI